MMKKKEVKKSDKKIIREGELIATIIIGIIFLVLLGFAISDKVFIPITMVSFALLLFSICYYYIEEENKKILVYILFGIGILLIISEVIYTLVNIL